MFKRILILPVFWLCLLQIVAQKSALDNTDILRQKFLNYCKSVPLEEVFVHTDRDEYVSGEDIFFSIYVIDRQTFAPSESRIVYFELLNGSNRPVIQKRILTTGGSGQGQVTLPDTLSTALYTLRAYSNRMKNFLPENCFMKEIIICNAMNDKPLSVYPIKWTGEGEVRSINKPGVSISVNYSDPDSLRIFLNAGPEFRKQNGRECSVFIQTRGNINYARAAKMTGDLTQVIVPVSSLNEGINQITIFNSFGEPVCEKYICTPLKREERIVIHSADSFGLRERITMNIGLPDSVTPADLSVSVTPLSDITPAGIRDYMVFGSEYGIDGLEILKNHNINELTSEQADTLLTHIRSRWADWSKILAGEQVAFRYKPEIEEHYLYGKLIFENSQAAVSPARMLMSAPGKTADFRYAETDSEGRFSFGIPIDDDLKDLIIMPDTGLTNLRFLIESSFSDLYLKNSGSFDSSEKLNIPFISRLSVNHQVRKIYGTPLHGNFIHPALRVARQYRFYGKPDIELNLSDYISLPVMSEIFIELLPDVSLKKKGRADEISITYRLNDHQFTTVPILMIDGVIIKDASLIAGLNPALLEKIDVVRDKYLVGKYIFPGIVNVISGKGDFSCVALPDYMVRIPYRVIDPVRSFISPDYSSEIKKEERIPDYRNTVYWNPSVKIAGKGTQSPEFWSSDNKSYYLISIQGITKDKRLVSAFKIIKVN